MKGISALAAATLLVGSCITSGASSDQGADMASAEGGAGIEAAPQHGDGLNRGDSLGRERPGSDVAPPAKAVTVVFAADIAQSGRTAHARALASLMTKHDPPVAAVVLGGDNARWNGYVLSFFQDLLTYYNNYYKPAGEADWGQFDAITFPQLGNHEYTEGNGQGYFDYFAARMTAIKALPGYDGFVDVVGKGYYSFDLNGWHLVSLNSNCGSVTGGCAAGSAQETWLKADLAKNSGKPIIGIWHAPRYACGEGHGDATSVQAFWGDLYDVGADFVFNGHNHYYQRWQPLDKASPEAVVDAAKGINEVVAGSYGVSTYSVCSPPDSRIAKQFGGDGGIGAFFLTISDDGHYSFEYQLENGTVFDSGSGTSHHHP